MVANLWTPNKGLLRDEPDLNFSLRKYLPSACACKSAKGKTSAIFQSTDTVTVVLIKIHKNTHTSKLTSLLTHVIPKSMDHQDSVLLKTLQTAPGLRSVWDCTACYIYYLKRPLSVNSGLNLQFQL